VRHALLAEICLARKRTLCEALLLLLLLLLIAAKEASPAGVALQALAMVCGSGLQLPTAVRAAAVH
jgi:uncharacterized protein YraI